MEWRRDEHFSLTEDVRMAGECNDIDMNTNIDNVLLKIAVWALLAARNLKWSEHLT